MKIAFIGGRDIFSVGGIENWMLHLPTRLSQMGHELVVYCESDKDAIRFYDEVKIVYVKAPRNRYFCKIFASFRATRMAIKAGCELIHYNVWPSAVWSKMAERKGLKTLLMGHGFEWKRSKYSSLQRYILQKMEARAARRHSQIILCSQEQTDWYQSQYACGDKVQTIPSAVDLPVRVPTSEEKMQESILYMGRISPEKNVDILIRAFENLQEAHPQARLLIAGSLDLNQSYGRKINAMMAANEHIDYLGEVRGEEKDALLRRTTLFCLPSSIEGLSIALLEAAAYELPIVASDLPSNHEALGESAFWVTPGEIVSLEHALHFALSAAESDRKRHVAAAYSRIAERYTWDKVAATYARYIENL